MTFSTHHAATPRLKALLIEDYPAVQDELAGMLEEHGFDVVIFASATEAGRQFSTPHLILIKTAPDDTDALEFAQWARRKSGKQQPYVIAMGQAEVLSRRPDSTTLWNAVLAWDAAAAVVHEHLQGATLWLTRTYPDLAMPRTERATFLEQTGLKRAPAHGSAGGFSEGKHQGTPVAAAASQSPVVSSPFRAAGPPRRRPATAVAAAAGATQMVTAGGQTMDARSEQHIPRRHSLPEARPSGMEMRPQRAPVARPAVPPTTPGPASPSPASPSPGSDSTRMRQLLDHLPMAVALFDRDMRYLAANKRWLEDFNLATIDVVGRSHYEIFPDLHENWMRVYQRALDGQTQCSDERIVDHPDGTRSWVRWEVTPWNDSGAIAGILISCQNITGQKQESSTDTAAAQPVASKPGTSMPIAPEPRMRPEAVDSAEVILRSVDAPAMALDLQGKVVFANRQLSSVLGNDALEGNKLWDIAGGGQRQILREACEAIATGFKDTGKLDIGSRLDFVLYDDAGDKFRLAWSGAPQKNADDEIVGMALFGALRQEEQAPSATPLETKIEELEAKLASNAEKDAEIATQLQLLEQEKTSALRQLTEAATLVRDLERKLAKAEASSAEVEKTLSAKRDINDLPAHVLDAIPLGVAVLDGEANILYSNDGFADLLGVSLEECGSIESWLRRGCPDPAHCGEVITQWWDRVWQAHTAKVFSLSDTSHVLRDIDLKPKALSGHRVLLLGSDVTDKRRTEDALRTSEARFRTLFRECGVGVGVVDRTGAILNVNPYLERMLGTNLVELRREAFESLLEPNDIPLKRELESRLRGGDPNAAGEVDVHMIHKSGEPVAVTLRSALVRNQAGKELFTAFFIRERAVAPTPVEADSREHSPPKDSGPTTLAPLSAPGEDEPHAVLTETPAEAPVPDSLERSLNAALLEATSTPILITDGKGRVLECNVAAEEFLQTEIDDLSGQILAVLFDGMDTTAFQESLIPTLKESGSFQGDVMINRGSGTESCSLQLFGVNDSAGELVSIIAAIDPEPAAASGTNDDAQDSGATGPDRETEGIRDCLHQIKNHLQILMSLQNLQMKKPEDPAVQSALLSTRNRLNAVAHVYQNVGTAETDASTIPFHRAGEALLQSLRRGWRDARPDVELKWRFDEMQLHTRCAVPLALVLNELVTNAFEHGFPDGKSGAIQVRLGTKPDRGTAVLRVANTGIKVSESDENPNGQGLAIVETLADQIGGTFRPSPEGKPEFRVVFPLTDASLPSEP